MLYGYIESISTFRKLETEAERNIKLIWLLSGLSPSYKVIADYHQFRFSVNGFARHMRNYITIRPTDLPKELPLSPHTVYQYDNGSVNFYGFDASASYCFIPELAAKAGINYLYG